MIDWDTLVLGAVAAQFGEGVIYAYANGATTPITGVYDEQYAAIDVVGGQASTSSLPVVGVQLSQLPVPPQQGDTLTIVRTGDIFVVKEVRPDGHGWAKLMLNLA
ncbi:MAG: hypothetical protein M0T84_00275 [Betaproteobacteria bacterium]|nr:hypothetical protein [Betaproteobacteria bacterium]